jgi:lambda family phage minor tail protein L
MTAIIADLNALSSDSVIAVLLEIEIPATPTVRICSNNEDVIFAGNTYLPFPFKLSELSTTAKGAVPEWQIQIDNTTRAIEQYLQLYDQYLKVHGISGNDIALTCYVVNTSDTSEAIMTEYFILTSFSTDTQWATFKLGARSPFTMRYPRRRILQNFCAWKFKSVSCGYAGSVASCDKSLSACRALDNAGRFGGFPGVGKGVRL